MSSIRELEPFEDHFWDFYNAQSGSVQKKIDYVLYIVRSTKVIPGKFFKHVEDGIYEIRVQLGNNIYRVFGFFEQGNVIVLLHGIVKKTQKLPRREIERAHELRRKYYESRDQA